MMMTMLMTMISYYDDHDNDQTMTATRMHTNDMRQLYGDDRDDDDDAGDDVDDDDAL